MSSASSSSSQTLDSKAALQLIEQQWAARSSGGAGVLETLEKYIAIPNQSPQFDPHWETNGFQDRT